MKTSELLWMLWFILSGEDRASKHSTLYMNLFITMGEYVTPKAINFKLLVKEFGPLEAEARHEMDSMTGNRLIDLLSLKEDAEFVEMFLRLLFQYLPAEEIREIEIDLIVFAKGRSYDERYMQLYDIMPIILQHNTRVKRELRIKKWHSTLLPGTGDAARSFYRYWTDRLKYYVEKKDWIRVWSDLKRALIWWPYIHDRPRALLDFIDIVYEAMLREGVLQPELPSTKKCSADDLSLLRRFTTFYSERIRVIRATSLYFERQKKKRRRKKAS